MEAWAYGTLALIGGIVVIASAFGAIAGTIAWRLNLGFISGLLSVVATYLLLSALLDFGHIKTAAYFGLIPVLVTSASANFMARYLTRRKISRLKTALAALATALSVGFIYVEFFGLYLFS